MACTSRNTFASFQLEPLAGYGQPAGERNSIFFLQNYGERCAHCAFRFFIYFPLGNCCSPITCFLLLSCPWAIDEGDGEYVGKNVL
jgi:hypothetical protein